MIQRQSPPPFSCVLCRFVRAWPSLYIFLIRNKNKNITIKINASIRNNNILKKKGGEANHGRRASRPSAARVAVASSVPWLWWPKNSPKTGGGAALKSVTYIIIGGQNKITKEEEEDDLRLHIVCSPAARVASTRPTRAKPQYTTWRSSCITPKEKTAGTTDGVELSPLLLMPKYAAP